MTPEMKQEFELFEEYLKAFMTVNFGGTKYQNASHAREMLVEARKNLVEKIYAQEGK